MISAMLAWLSGWPGYAAAAVAGLAAGVAVGKLRAARRGPAPDPHADIGVDQAVAIGPLVDGLIAAHDLAAGSQAVRAHVESVLRRAGVQRVTAERDAPFDSSRHQAVATEGAGHMGGVPVIIREVRPGWYTDSGLIRPAEVAVSAP